MLVTLLRLSANIKNFLAVSSQLEPVLIIKTHKCSTVPALKHIIG